jgi:NAD(P)-dependent dehydrogenase (short-subunit alcohol dehydrogenase family)
MAIELAGRPIAITGASSGIGLATALACAHAGMPVTLAARREDRLTQAVDQIRAAGGRAIAVRADVDNPDDCRALIERTISEFGSIYAVFANAGYGAFMPISTTPDEDLRAIFETNLWGTLNTIRPALEHMQQAAPPNRGHILICSSCLSKFALPFSAPYSATKAAQDHFGRSLRIELHPKGIHVSTVHPVGTITELFDKAKERSRVKREIGHSPRLLMQPPERVANAIVRCLRRPRSEVWTSAITRLAFAASIAAPGVRDWAARRVFLRKLET